MEILQAVPVVLGAMGPLIPTVLIGFIAILLLKWYFSRNLDYWKKKGVPFVKPYPIFGSILEDITKPLHEALQQQYKKLGRIYGYYEGNRALLSVGDPDILRDILVKDFHAFIGRRAISTGDIMAEKMLPVLQGDDWKRVRTIMTAPFTTRNIKKMIGIFNECSKTVVNNFKQAAEKEGSIDAKRLYGAFSMDIIASFAFSTKIDSHNDPDNQFLAVARQVFLKFNWRVIMYMLFPGLTKLFKVRIFPRKAMDFFTAATLEVIEERKKTGETRNDFLQLLLDNAKEVAAEEEKTELTEKETDIAENYIKVEEDIVFKNVKKSLSVEELVAQCVIFFVVGYDKMSSALSFTSYLLALHPEIQEKVIKELNDVLKQNDGELTYEAIQSMKYLDNVISETLRLYSPVIRFDRVAEEDYKLGDTGIVVPKGMIISIPVYAIHRDPEFFPDPEKFDPDRFSPDERNKRNPYAYIPFGAGPRNCVGIRFALMEVKVCLAYVLSNFRIKKSSQTKVPLDFNTGQGLLQPKDIILDLEVRKDAVKAL